jgi:hypothetical protein
MVSLCLANVLTFLHNIFVVMGINHSLMVGTKCYFVSITVLVFIRDDINALRKDDEKH